MQKKKIGVSIGDYNGIGIEVFIKAIQYKELNNKCLLDDTNIIFYGPCSILKYYSRLLSLDIPSYSYYKNENEIRKNVVNIPIDFEIDDGIKVNHGVEDVYSAVLTLKSLDYASHDAINGIIDAIVTLPVNKFILQDRGFDFPGHTEYLCHVCSSDDVLMLMCTDKLKIGVITGHIPINMVSGDITKELIINKLTILRQGLVNKFGIENPRIAIIGLNPHAGEKGNLGNEEMEVVVPAIKGFYSGEAIVEGPYPADGFFGTRRYNNYDAVLAMYHDQGLIPFKMLAFNDGVNITLGLPIIRTSPAHGTAYDIVGSGKSSFQSCYSALRLAYDLASKKAI